MSSLSQFLNIYKTSQHLNDSVENSCNHCLLCEEFLECRVPNAVPFKVSPGVNAPFVPSALPPLHKRSLNRLRTNIYWEHDTQSSSHRFDNITTLKSDADTDVWELGATCLSMIKNLLKYQKKNLVNCLSVHYIILQIIIKNPNILPDSKGLFGFLFSPYIKPGCGLLQFLDQKAASA